MIGIRIVYDGIVRTHECEITLDSNKEMNNDCLGLAVLDCGLAGINHLTFTGLII